MAVVVEAVTRRIRYFEPTVTGRTTRPCRAGIWILPVTPTSTGSIVGVEQPIPTSFPLKSDINPLSLSGYFDTLFQRPGFEEMTNVKLKYNRHGFMANSNIDRMIPDTFPFR